MRPLPIPPPQLAPERPVAPAPALQGVRVLVDTFNLRHPTGTGIRRYGQTLVSALGALGADVSLLTDRNKRAAPLPELEEVLFFDAREAIRPPRRRWRELLNMAGAAVRARRPEEISFRNVVAPLEQLGEVRASAVYNLRDCFEAANRLFQRTRLPTRVELRRAVDVWHATYPLPITVRGARQVTTVHDLIPLRLPHTTLDDKVFFYRLLRDSLRRSDLVLTVSEHTRRDLLERFDVDPDKVLVTWQPVAEPEPSTQLGPREVERLLRHRQLKPGSYILFVGNIEPKKNLGRLIEAWAGLDTDLPLVVVGRKAWLWEQELRHAEPLLATRGRKPPRLRLLDFLPRDELEALYANAALLAFPSLYEGFGLPPLEAMSHGCPVLTSETSSLPELCGDAALYVDPFSVSDLRAKLTMLLESDSLRRQLALKGRRQVRRFSPEVYQRRLTEAYRRVL